MAQKGKVSGTVLKPGRCMVCGCTERRPCVLGFAGLPATCSWVDPEKRTLCSAPSCITVVAQACELDELLKRNEV